MTIEQTISNWVDDNSDHIIKTLCDMIEFQSITKINPKEAGPGEKDCQEFLKARLESLGMATDLWEPDGPQLLEKYRNRPGANPGRTFDGRPNLGGTLKGTGKGRSLMLTGHIDVVPIGERSHWNSDPFEPKIENGLIQGRGSVDMKGGVCAMLCAIECLVKNDLTPKGDIVFTTVVDEEIGGMGSLAMVDRGFSADAGIMTEPTNNRLSPICHGVLWGKIKIKGIGGHAELLPNSWDKGGPVDAISLCRYILDGIDKINERWKYDPKKNHPLMDLPNQIIPTMMSSGEHPASTAGYAEITIDVQYLPDERDEFGKGGHVKKEVDKLLSNICMGDPYLCENPAYIDWFLDADCEEIPSDNPFVQSFQNSLKLSGINNQPVGFGAHSDIGIPSTLGKTPTVNFGPGDPTQAHQPNEAMDIESLLECTKALALTTYNWCNEEKNGND
ncbi:MAG: acetylornithine deacetylase [Gammaproteobacteria bacterium]|nr:acetylornithine deacetylase [Gammaproteobacteria bacterium]